MSFFHFIKNQTQKQYPAQALPSVGKPDSVIKRTLNQIADELKTTDADTKIGWLHARPHPIALDAYRRILPYNPNNIGNWSSQRGPAYTTQKLEREIVKTTIALHRGTNKTTGGYLTSGATEGILFSFWLGRKKLEEKRPKTSVCAIGTSLTHYSIKKASDIVGLSYVETPLDKTTWNMHPTGLLHTIRRLKHNGYRGFIVVLTLGYTQTGTSDDVPTIQKAIHSVLDDTSVFGIIDAASNGFFLPFIKKGVSPFQYTLIDTFVTDFHKHGLAPYPAGIVLYRRSLLPRIEKSVPYLTVSDATLLGSRPGVNAAAVWAIMQHLGKQGLRRLYRRQLLVKRYCISQLRRKVTTVSIITDATSLSCGIIIPSTVKHKALRAFEEKYGLLGKPASVLFYPNETKKIRVHTLFFMPHMKKRIIETCIEDLRKIIVK